MRKLIRRFIHSKDGATAIEYGLIVALVSLAVVVGVGAVGNQVAYMWGDNNSRMNQGLNTH